VLLLGNGLATHLASAGRAGFVEGLENEALCMELAAALALPVPSTLLLEGAPPLLLTARPDRPIDPRGGIRRRHVESLPQVAGLHPECAFEREGGLSLRDCVELLRRHSVAPAPDIRHLLRWVAFCFLAGIGEGHARTLLLVASSEGPRLAIDGGLFSSHLDAAQSDRLALSIGGEDRPDWLRLARWVDLADELGVGRRYLLELVAGVATDLPAIAARVVGERPRLARSRATVPRLLRLVANRARQTRIALTAEGRGAFEARGGEETPALRDQPPATPA
jgi:serine/threonine-protein kinase HipA